MQDHPDASQETRILASRKGLRETIAQLPEFIDWRSQRPEVTIDDEVFIVVGHDQLKDADQAMVEWVRQFRPDLLEELD